MNTGNCEVGHEKRDSLPGNGPFTTKHEHYAVLEFQTNTVATGMAM